MRAGGAPAQADITDSVAAMHVLPGCNRKAGEVAVASRDAVAMIHHDGLTVSAKKIGEGYDAICGRDDGMTIGAANIHATVKSAFSIEGINPLPEAARDLAVDWPQVGGRIGAVPVCRGGVASHSK